MGPFDASKADVRPLLRQFFPLIENQFKTSIKVIDNGPNLIHKLLCL